MCLNKLVLNKKKDDKTEKHNQINLMKNNSNKIKLITLRLKDL